MIKSRLSRSNRNEYSLRPVSDDSYSKPRRPLPFIYNGYTERLPERRKRAEDRLSYLKVKTSNEYEVKWITFGERERSLERRDWLAKHVWKQASSTTDFNKNRLSSFTVFEFFDHIASESEEESKIRRLERRRPCTRAGVNFTDADGKEDDEVVMYLEDDAFPVYRFRDKYDIFDDQLIKSHPDWDIAWLGALSRPSPSSISHRSQFTCAHISVNPMLQRGDVKLRVAIEVMERGSVTEEYLPIDHLFNSYRRAKLCKPVLPLSRVRVM